MRFTRRRMLAGLGLAGLGAAVPSLDFARQGASASRELMLADSGGCPFRLSVINDEITQDFEKACQIVAVDFGLRWIELRSMWDKNVTELFSETNRGCSQDFAGTQTACDGYCEPAVQDRLAGGSAFSAERNARSISRGFRCCAQDKLLDRCIALCKSFETDRIRCFDFWRLDDPKPYRAAINAKLRQAAERCAKEDLILLLENEMSCNTATGEEAAVILRAIPNRNFMLNWDPGNAAAVGSTPYPTGYDLLPKERIGHCHCKDVVRKADHTYDWAPVGSGIVDWVGQLQALRRDGFHYGLSLETHWRGAGTPEASTRVSMDGLRKTLAKAGIAC